VIGVGITAAQNSPPPCNPRDLDIWDGKATGVGAGRLGHLRHTPRPSLVGGRWGLLAVESAGHAARAACFAVLALMSALAFRRACCARE
jgi:hypothetical protein